MTPSSKKRNTELKLISRKEPARVIPSDDIIIFNNRLAAQI